MVLASLNPSKIQAGLILLAVASAIFGVWISTESAALRAAFSFAILIAGFQQVASALRLDNQGIREVEKIGNDWWIRLNNGHYRKTRLTKSRVVLPWFVYAVFDDGRRRYPFAVLRDAVSQTEHRRLRMAIWWEPQPVDAQATAWLTESRWYQNSIGRLGR